MNLLISRHDKIGDFVLSLPMIKIAKKGLINTKIIVLVSKINYDFAQSLEFIDDVILYEDTIFSLAKKIKEKNIDVSISAFIDTKLALALLFAGVKKRYAPATKLAQVFSNYRVIQRRSEVKMKEFEYNIQLLQAFDSNIKNSFQKPLLEFDKSERLEQLELFKKQYNITENFRYVVLHPGFGGSSDGNLTLADYIKLAKSISGRDDIKIVFTFGPDDFKSKKYIHENIDFDAILFDSALSLNSFCKLLSNFELFISTSTGPMHLAGAVNLKTISFFGDSLFASDKRWGTISDEKNQNNFMITEHYTRDMYNQIETNLTSIIEEI